MRLYFITVGIDSDFEEHHRYFFRVASCPEEVIKKVSQGPKGEFHFDSLVELNHADGRKIKIGVETGDEKLFAAFIGYYLEGDPIEHHSVIFVAEKNLREAKRKVKSVLKIMDAITPHVDGIRPLDEVDGFKVSLESGPSSANRFFYHDDIKNIMEDF